jgi:endoglucanase
VKFRAVVAASTAVLASALGVFAVGHAAQAATGCSVSYAKNDWGSGFTTNITIKNLGDALSGWTLTYSYTGNQTLANGWSGTWSQSGKNITVTNAAWNGGIASGGSTTIGAQFSYSGTNTDPASFAINGSTCTGGTSTTSPSPSPTTTSPTPNPTSAPKLHVSGNKLVNASGSTVTLRGVNRSGGEYMCIQGYGIWDGAVDDTATAAIASWKTNAVRVPLNEDCWLGESWVNSAYSGANYQAAVKAYVATLEAHGLTPILDLHWTYGLWTGNDSHCTVATATCQKPMPDAAESPAFWTSVANTFKGDTAVMFDLFNEPYPNNIGTMTYDQSWACWRDGGSACTGLTYTAAGMQTLINSIRATGAQNVIMTGGNSYSNDFSSWATYKPTDSTGNLVASWHSYNFNYCASSSCWDSTIAPVLSGGTPLVASEIGENDCGHGYIDTLMAWLDSHGASYTAWTWNAWDCSSGPALISNLDGTPTAYGAGYKAHLATF